jgi:hypothetical protein
MIGTKMQDSTITMMETIPMSPSRCRRKRRQVIDNWLASAGANRSCTLISVVAIFLASYLVKGATEVNYEL